MNTKFWRLVVLTLGLVMCSSLMKAQTRVQRPDPCSETPKMSQAEMSDCAVKELQKTEMKLEKLLKDLGIRRDSPEQKAWETYRDAQLAALYPKENMSSYGSVYPMCLAVLKRALTEGRIRDLNALTTSGEGDVCYGYRASGGTTN